MLIPTPRRRLKGDLLPEIAPRPCATLARRDNFALRRRIVRVQTGRFS
jgi:hypothetical protein